MHHYSSDVKTDIILSLKKNLKENNFKESLDVISKYKESNPKFVKSLNRVKKVKRNICKTSVLLQHRLIWFHEFQKLCQKELELQRGIHNQLMLIETSELISREPFDDNDEYTLLEELKDLKRRIHHDCTKDSSQQIRLNMDNIRRKLHNRKLQLDLEMNSITKDLKTIKPEPLLLDESDWNPYINVNDIAQPFMTWDCLDSEVVTQRRLDYENLYNQYHTQLHSLQMNYLEKISSNESKSKWSADEHFLFKKILDEYASEAYRRISLTYERLGLEFPNKTKEELHEHDEWIHRLEFYKETLKNLNALYKWSIKGFIQRTMDIYKETDKFILENQVKLQDKANRLEKMQVMHSKIKTWRDLRLNQIKKFEIQIAKEMELQRELKEQECIKRHHEMLLRKHEVEKHHQTLAELTLKQKQMQHFHQLQESRERIQLMKQNQTRIEYREQQRIEKEQEKKLAAYMNQQQQLKKAQRLDKLRESVSVSVPIEPNRIYKETTSFKESKKASNTTPLFVNYGFTNDKIIQDKRLRLFNALQSQGLHNTEYGRQILESIKGEAPRDFKSHFIF